MHTLKPYLEIEIEWFEKYVFDHMGETNEKALREITHLVGDENYLQLDSIKGWFRLYPVSHLL
jgi:hypothetical protein